VADPVAAGAGEDGRGDSVLFEDVALDRGRGAVVLVFFDASIFRSLSRKLQGVPRNLPVRETAGLR
jgi:hypothetical protein